MELTYFLVDFENVQPPDLGLLRAPQYRVKLFHGPHQNKLDMDIVKALQPLGDQVEYVQSERHGKNALDFHVAFYLGRLVERHESIGKSARFVVVSKDRDFDPLLSHLRSLGYPAQQVVTIRDALGDGADAPVDQRDDLSASAPIADVPGAPEAAPAKAPAQKAPSKPAAAPKKQAAAKKPAADIIEKVVEHLRTHPKARPAKRVTLERHILSLLGGTTSAATVQGVITELVRLKQVAFDDMKVSYPLKGKK